MVSESAGLKKMACFLWVSSYGYPQGKNLDNKARA